MYDLVEQFFPGNDGNYWKERNQGKYNLPPYLYNWTSYPYANTYLINTTLYSNEYGVPDSDMDGDTWDSYWSVDVTGEKYAWTNLFVSTNATDFFVCLLQDLKWIDNDGPNMEILGISAFHDVGVNRSYQFGVLSDDCRPVTIPRLVGL